MIVTCKECKTNFNLDESLLEENGSKVRCSICKDIFFAYPPASARMPDTSPDISTGDKIPEDFNSSQENLQSLHNDDISNDIDVPTAAFDTEIETDLKLEDLPVNTESLISDNAIASKILVEEKEPEKLSLNLDMGESLLEEHSEVPEDIDLALDMDIENPLQDEQEEISIEPDELSMDIDLESNDTAQETIEEEVKAVEEAIVEEPAELSLDL
ncbi:MAG: zinc-ribbon domain-containing protein, partial [Desulfosarcina sp.]|nr:zinc-ribbon domain-containing protein [Desulfobacterales bacterium]